MNNIEKAVYRPKAWIGITSTLLMVIFLTCGFIPLKMSFDYSFDFMLFFMGFMSLTAGLVFMVAICSRNRKITLSENGIQFGMKKIGWDNITVLGYGKEKVRYKAYVVTLGTRSHEYLAVLAKKPAGPGGKSRTYRIYQRSYSKYQEICERIQDGVKTNGL